jgi:F-box protein 11
METINSIQPGTFQSFTNYSGPKSRFTGRSEASIRNNSSRTKSPWEQSPKEREDTQFPVTLEVDQDDGPYFTIQSAIDNAKPNTSIQVHSGIYKESLIIREPSIKIESKDYRPDVYIMGQKGPALIIDTPAHGSTVIQNIRFLHRGTNNAHCKAKPCQLNSEHEVSERFNFGGLGQINDLLMGLETYHKDFNSVSYSSKVDSMILVKHGGIILRNCLMTLSYLSKCNQNVVPMICLCPGTYNTITSCELRGSLEYPTTGIVSNKAKLIVKDTNISNFAKGGIMVWCEEDDCVKILTSTVSKCQSHGIQAMGSSEFPLIEFCTIEDNKGCGIQVCTGNSAQIRRNDIHNNEEGVEIISADPTLYKNTITKNNLNGIMTRAVEDLICSPKISDNNVSSNRNNGIHCVGYNNLTRIQENPSISFNRFAGIKIDHEACTSILKNQIFKNIHQGIVICERASSHIEENDIFENIKANLAFGGEGSANNSIIKNNIYGGRCEGVFIIESGKSLLYKNNIYGNYDGIVICTSTCQVYGNKICRNRRNGVLILKDGRPDMEKNRILENAEVGVFIRDKSKGGYRQNVILYNNVNLIIENPSEFTESLHLENDVDGDIRTPYNYKCSVM